MDYLNHVKQQIISERILVFLNLKKKRIPIQPQKKLNCPWEMEKDWKVIIDLNLAAMSLEELLVKGIISQKQNLSIWNCIHSIWIKFLTIAKIL